MDYKEVTFQIDPNQNLLEQMMKEFKYTEKEKEYSRKYYLALWLTAGGYYEEAEKICGGLDNLLK